MDTDKRRHSWQSGMMAVDAEDIDSIATMRLESASSLPECSWCEAVYHPDCPPGDYCE